MEDKQSRYKMLKELFTLRGDVVITGAAGLMGQSHAEAVLEAGGNVILIDMENSRILVVNSLHYNNKKYKYDHKKLLLDPFKKGK